MLGLNFQAKQIHGLDLGYQLTVFFDLVLNRVCGWVSNKWNGPGLIIAWAQCLPGKVGWSSHGLEWSEELILIKPFGLGEGDADGPQKRMMVKWAHLSKEMDPIFDCVGSHVLGGASKDMNRGFETVESQKVWWGGTHGRYKAGMWYCQVEESFLRGLGTHELVGWIKWHAWNLSASLLSVKTHTCEQVTNWKKFQISVKL